MEMGNNKLIGVMQESVVFYSGKDEIQSQGKRNRPLWLGSTRRDGGRAKRTPYQKEFTAKGKPPNKRKIAVIPEGTRVLRLKTCAAQKEKEAGKGQVISSCEKKRTRGGVKRSKSSSSKSWGCWVLGIRDSRREIAKGQKREPWKKQRVLRLVGGTKGAIENYGRTTRGALKK